MAIFRKAIALAAVVSIFGTSGFAQGVRVAISVGINDYPGEEYDLYRAVNDADAVAQTFHEMGYTSYGLLDVTIDDFTYELDYILNNLGYFAICVGGLVSSHAGCPPDVVV